MRTFQQSVKLEGVHHVTAITGDAPANLAFYRDTLGLRLVKKTVNQDDPTVYHLFYADDRGSAGADITFFEYPRAGAGRAGDGMVHRVVFRVGSEASLDFWEQRVGGERSEGSLAFVDSEGLAPELVVDQSGEPPLVARNDAIPEDHALRGFAGVRAYATAPERSGAFLRDALGFAPDGDSGRTYVARGEERSGFYADVPPGIAGAGGAGTVHHVAWASTMDDHEEWRQQVMHAGVPTTPIIDRFYFRSIYFREPNGILFEIATLGPGFATDEDAEHLGESLSLPPDFEHLRARLEGVLILLDA